MGNSGILSVQIGSYWLQSTISVRKQQDLARIKQDYLSQPAQSFPGVHDIYFLYLTDLTTIIRNNANLFVPIIPNIQYWILRLELIRLSRNIVGHMNWLNSYDIQEIRRTYLEIKPLINNLHTSGINILIP